MIHQKSHSELDQTLDYSPCFKSWLGLLSCSPLPYLVISRSQELTSVVDHIRCKASLLNSSSVGCFDLRDALLTDKSGPSVSDTCLPCQDKKIYLVLEDKKQFHNHSFMAFCHGQIPVTSQVAELCVLCHCSNIFIINCYILSRDTFHTLGQLSVGSSVSRHFPYTCIILFKCELLSEYILHKFTVAYSYCALIQECHFPMLFLFSSDVASPWILFTNNNHI